MFGKRSSKIRLIKAREILDSRGNPTIEVTAKTSNLSVKAAVPSGASIGQHEAKELRDNDLERYSGKGVLKTIQNINRVIGPRLILKDVRNQKEIDDILIKLDNTKDKSHLGANAIVGVSMAVAKLGAQAENIPLWHHLSLLSHNKEKKLPYPCFNIINGGVHAGSDLALQEFMIVPKLNSFKENLRRGVEIYSKLKEILKEEYGKPSINVGDEGGFVPPISSTQVALEVVKKASQGKEIELILDCAASQFYKQDNYVLENSVFTKEGLLEFYKDICSKYPIIGLEDPFAGNDWQGFEKIMDILGEKILIIGDDLLATNTKRIKEARDKAACNAAIIKINQIGTVSEAMGAANLAKSFGWQIIVSHRSGDVCDSFIADFAVGVSAEYIKAGAPARGERLIKYNRLLEIEKES